MDMLKLLAQPSNVIFLLTVIGLVLGLAPRMRRFAGFSLAAAALLLVVFSCGKTATWLLSPLEYEYPRVPDQPAPVRAIVVLAAYAANDPNMALSDRPNSATLYRVVEGVHLWRRCQDCAVIVTGSAPTTEVMRDLMVSLGVPVERVQLDSDSADTATSAIHVARMLGRDSFYLVTSAGHMPRSIAVFEAAGMRPLAAPTDHRLPMSVANADWNLSTFHLECSDLAVHERLGMWWYRLRGQV